jgi:hypothetical protein
MLIMTKQLDCRQTNKGGGFNPTAFSMPAYFCSMPFGTNCRATLLCALRMSAIGVCP